ncbi:urea ABC transporter permease subunit UrtB [Sneathiella aquimaris]|uniref:urea ABC transporter permease subunit UrtB n=1 Tax=Sneathiella aquimaris TaxID=2599305 RepID=UPI00146C499E|nr:urea ABC transporter permease subunit UrtB [Sneathiella aquimaris]
MLNLRILIVAIALTFCSSISAIAHHDDLNAHITALAKGGLKDRAKQVDHLLKTGDPKIIPVLEHLADGTLFMQKADRAVVLTEKNGKKYTTTDPLTGERKTDITKGALKKIKTNNSLRRKINEGLNLFSLSSADPAVRLDAAQSLLKTRTETALAFINVSVEKETVEEVKTAMENVQAVLRLSIGKDTAERLAALETIAQMGGREALPILAQISDDPNPYIVARAAKIEATILKELKLWDSLQNVWYGLSLGSVLLLASIGLAITFGVMGVINMAHGEMVMIGAYSAYVAQQVVLALSPTLVGYSLVLALPLAFLTAGTIGFVMERGIIRFLYGRPLETLLATWGVSLFLQQTVRTVFGPTNQEVANPDWMSGALAVGEISLTWNRIWILLFAAAVFAFLFFLLKKTRMGLQMRAVTQNRSMASSMGIKTPWVDAFTFALGSGIAGIAGVALSQIGNVSPNLGQTYIIDSFMVVVFGGVGNLWGTLIGALSLGIANKFIEPFSGAVLAKIMVLTFIILFIQKRPRGLFALKGRAVEQ